MSGRTYVVTRSHKRGAGDAVVYAGEDPDAAKRVADEEYQSRDASRSPTETFIHVWVDGDHQFATREHPEEMEP